MRVKQVEFIGAMATPESEPPSRLPQVAVAGRSNVGKSSLINAMLGRKRIARVSKRPGKTREVNFFEVNGRFCLVDLPGYGFARAPAEIRQKWGPLVESYLATAPDLLGLVLLIDCRHGPTEDDAQMYDYLARLELPALFTLTKIDKLSRSKRREAVERTLEELDVPEDQLAVTSAVTGEGVETLLASVDALLESAADGGPEGDPRAVAPG